MKFSRIYYVFLLSVLSLNSTTLVAQNGDQMLDGIGETALIARYIFDGNAKDWSRNNLHATLSENAEFTSDSTFNKVLSLTDAAFVQLPQTTLNSMESLSISTWIKLDQNTENQTENPFDALNLMTNSGPGEYNVENSENRVERIPNLGQRVPVW